MRRLSTVRSLALALLGLTLVLAVLAGVGVATLYATRQTYENRLGNAYALETASGRLLAASVIEEATRRLARGAGRARRRARAEAAFGQAISEARDLAAPDPISQGLLGQIAASQARLRRRGRAASAPLRTRERIAELASRQRTRRDAARASARHDSRSATASIAIAGGLAVIGALGLVYSLLSRMRDPLSELVRASRRLAEGDLKARVHESGPDELRVLGGAFNAMADDLSDALGRVESERHRLFQTIESLGDALIVVEADGTIAAANPRAARLLPELRPGRSVADAGDRLPPVAEALEREVTLEREGATLAATAAPLETASGDRGGGYVWTVRDVTERARLERLKSEFVATASHELRSPLTSIKGFVELLGQETLSAKQHEFLEIILLSTDRLVELVNDLLDVARIEAGRVEIVRRPTDLGELAREVAALMGPRVRDKSQDLALEVPPGLPRALADPPRVRQILVNLLTNAHLYTPAGGHLAVRLGAEGRFATIAVSDDGPGIDAEDLAQIFERFYRGTGEGRGTGLGLSIVKSLTELQEGEIDVRSVPGKGTTFLVRLPRSLGETIPPARAALRGKRVLVVDDEPEVARLIVERLAALGVAAEAVYDGREAIARLRCLPRFDALTLDVLMPGMSGFEVLRELRGDPELAGLPVVIVSVFSGRKALSGEWVVSKPIDTEQLADALGAAVRTDRVRVLVVGRREVRDAVAQGLEDLGIAYDWAGDRRTAGDLSAQRRFEVALVDAGLPEVETVISEIELRGRRPGRAVLVFNAESASPGVARLGAIPVSVEEAGAAVIAVLGETGPSTGNGD